MIGWEGGGEERESGEVFFAAEGTNLGETDVTAEKRVQLIAKEL